MMRVAGKSFMSTIRHSSPIRRGDEPSNDRLKLTVGPVTQLSPGRWERAGSGTIAGLFSEEICQEGWRPHRDSKGRYRCSGCRFRVRSRCVEQRSRAERRRTDGVSTGECRPKSRYATWAPGTSPALPFRRPAVQPFADKGLVGCASNCHRETPRAPG